VFLPWAPWRIQGLVLPGNWCRVEMVFFFPLWKFLAMNITQISGACSLIRQKWAWRYFSSTTEIDFPPFLWLMQPTWRKVIKAWSYCWERLSMTNLSGRYVVIARLWECYWECNSGTQNTAVSCASGTVGTRRITMYINCGLNEHHWRQGIKISSVPFLFFRRN